MAWEDRIREAAYNSPSGNRFVFTYENVRQTVDKKTAAFNFPDTNGTFIQDLGHTGRVWPLRVIFWGDDYDVEADAFEAALLERGVGVLEHPMYGNKKVVPFGRIARRDDLKTAANQAIIQVEFYETIELVYPTSAVSPADQILAAVQSINSILPNQFDLDVDINTALEEVSFRDRISVATAQFESFMQPIYDTSEDTRLSAEAVVDSINTSLDILAGDPLSYAFQFVNLMQLPARASALISDRISAYGNLISIIIDNVQNVAMPGNDNQSRNRFFTNDYSASTAISGQCLSVINGEFETRAQAISAAESIITIWEQWVAWREQNYINLSTDGLVDTGEIYQQIVEAVTNTVAFIIQSSFDLPTQKTFTLDRARTPLDLVAELYGELDERLDFFIDTNNLVGEELFEIKAGREIVYFV